MHVKLTPGWVLRAVKFDLIQKIGLNVVHTLEHENSFARLWYATLGTTLIRSLVVKGKVIKNYFFVTGCLQHESQCDASFISFKRVKSA